MEVRTVSRKLLRELLIQRLMEIVSLVADR